MKKPKIVELIIDETEDIFGIQAISLVSNPAIERNWVALSKDNFLSLAKIDEEKRTLVGVALMPEKEIPRYSEDDGEYLVFFSKETIEKAQELFMNGLKNNKATVEHKEDIDGVSVIETWIKEDENDKSNLYGFQDVPIGSWFVKMKVYNNEVWQQVKENKLRGFSIEGYFVDRAVEMQKEDILSLAEECIECEQKEVMEEIKSVLMEAELKPDLTLDGTPIYKDIEKAELYGQLFYDCIGSHPHEVDGYTYYMGCKSHQELMKKRKKKIDYRTAKYRKADTNSLAKYDWDQCIRDQMKEYGNKETAEKVCAAIKNKTVKR
mgnify:FL=1|jgi:hypothetical protein|tara:strand:+ start:9654 stop:10616 length:963 start_codon:yes stop_codon:yes gene_type:complete